MFRCRECGCEFKEKPDYCDCGNNTFDEILPQKSAIDIPDIRQIVSVLIFVLCLILAIIPWTIPDKPQTQEKIVKKAQPAAQKIPDIEDIWNDKLPKAAAPVQKPAPAPVKVQPEPAAPKPVQKQTTVVKKQTPAKKTTAPKKVTTKKTTPVKTQTSKPAAKPTASQKQTKPAQQAKTTQNKPPKVVEKVAQQVSQPKQTKKTVQPKKTQEAKPKPVDKTPLINYKNELRIALLAKLNVPNVTGTGDCAVSFSIDTATGKLLNRNFIYKSSNKSVNDEVYYMLMRLPYFKKPPSLYKGETIKMKFYFNNGYYEISFL